MPVVELQFIIMQTEVHH